MRVLLFTLCYLPDAAPNASVMTTLAEGLADLGHEVFVVTAFPHYGQNSPYVGYGGWRFKYESFNGIRISRTPIYVGKEGSTVGKILSWLSFNLIGTWAALKAPRVDVIISPSPPPTLGLSDWLLSRLWRIPFIYNVQDIYPDVAIEQGLLANPQLIALLQKLERLVYDKAAAMTVVSDVHRARLLAKGVPPRKVVVIPNAVDTDFLRPLPRSNPWSAEQRLDGRFVVTYAGNIGVSQGLETILDAARSLRQREHILFLVIGRGTGKSLLEAQARSRELTNIRFLPYQPRDSVPQLYASADVHLVFLRPDVASSFPSKTYSIMAAGRPLLAVVDGGNEVGSLVRRTNTGLVVQPKNPQALVKAILRLAHDQETRHRMGERARRYVERHHSKQTVALMYDALIRRLVTK